MVLWLAACAWISDDDLTSVRDVDGDGFVSAAFDGPDCDDADADVHPDATEVCDGIDNDCDGQEDEEEASPRPYYKDMDRDGYGNFIEEAFFCRDEQPPEFVEQPGDCDDGDEAVNPDADEVCDEVDNDCDDEVDEDATDAVTWYGDKDGDGVGADEAYFTQCESPDGRWVTSPGDCDDDDETVYEGADEVCDGVDNDCDDDVDEDAVDQQTWYLDADGDGYGLDDDSEGVVECEAPTGYVDDNSDCDDTDAWTYPGAPELCDDADNDCDAGTDFDIYVPSDVSTIVGAVSAASAGDEICVEPGTYNEPIQLVAKQVSVHGYGPDETILDGTGLAHPIYLYGINSGLTVSGFTVENGDNTYGSALYVENSSATLRDLVIRDNVSTAGSSESCAGGTALIQGSGAPVLQNVVFRDNTMECGYGWGIVELKAPNVTMENVAFVDNVVDADVRSYGVVTMYGSGTLDATNVIVANNSVSAGTDIVYGLGFSSFPGWTVNLTNVVVAENTGSGPTCNGAVYAEGTLNITNSSITGNTCPNTGAVHTVNGEPTITYSNVFGNSAPAFNFTDPTGSDGNVSEAPRFEDTSAEFAADWDFTLQSTSLLIDAGDPSILDPDDSVSDIGAHGGPLGDSW